MSKYFRNSQVLRLVTGLLHDSPSSSISSTLQVGALLHAIHRGSSETQLHRVAVLFVAVGIEPRRHNQVEALQMEEKLGRINNGDL
ncbi:hypothetical protein DY000_02028992 [Brassica cretica]|uniref:Uncharacterized protein n=1 Tax=Brassica cretica TaxID=69181 RepID=A0ABQ7DY90_BRACR|nr:hypothetical protein DY000_02028992 [Brassica cretica]